MRSTSTWMLGLILGSMLGARAGLAQFGGSAAGGFGGSAAYGGNAGSAATYGSNYSRDPAANERAKRYPSYGEGAARATFIDAGVLMNVRADEYVAVFAVSAQGATTAESNAKMQATLSSFKQSLRTLGVRDEDLFVDFVAQVRLYAYKIEEQTATEQLVGFELKKNVSIHFKDTLLLDKLAQAASGAGIYDLVKVDYVVREGAAIRERLREQAFLIIRRKAARYQDALGLKLSGPAQVLADLPSVYFPIEQYDSYTAQEAETVELRSSYNLIRARKSRTSYFNPLSPNLFDVVINPVIIEPVVQFTSYIKVKYEPSRK